jgi:hypothetical protein
MLAFLLQRQAPLTPAAVGDTIARIVLERGYYRNVTSTLLSRAWEWLSRTLRDLFLQAAGSRGTYLVSLSLIALVILAAIARSVIVARARRQAAARRVSEASAADLRAKARGLAAQGAFVEAHLLYAAVVARLVEAKQVRRHPSKTVGDYFRDLRAAGLPAATPYRAFAQTYDIVAYGDGVCDAVRYARLEQLATPLLDMQGAPADTAARAA